MHSKRRTSEDEEGVEDEAAAGACSATGEWNMNSGGRPEGNARILIEACWNSELEAGRKRQDRDAVVLVRRPPPAGVGALAAVAGAWLERNHTSCARAIRSGPGWPGAF